MKKIYLLLTLILFELPVYSMPEIPYINCYPYKEYKKDINLTKTYNSQFNNSRLEITKNVYDFSCILKKTSKPYEFLVKNISDTPICLLGCISDRDYWNRDMNRKHGSRWGTISKSTFTNGPSYIPVYGCAVGANADKEKYPFIRDFPKKIIIEPSKTIRILAIGNNKDKIQAITFVFKQDNEEFKINF